MTHPTITIRLKTKIAVLLLAISVAGGHSAFAADQPVDAVAGPAAIPGSPQSADIFAYPPDYYAVQIVAVQTKQQILDLLGQYELGDPPYGVMKTNGKLWYVLVYGVYPDYESAKMAMSELPPGVLKLKPWVRDMGSLQDAIRAAHPVQ